MVFHLPGSFLNGPKNCLAQTLHLLWFVEKSDGLRKIVWHKSSIHLRLAANPMVWKSFLVHKLSIRLRLAANPMV
jgi:hypothetical protein